MQKLQIMRDIGSVNNDFHSLEWIYGYSFCFKTAQFSCRKPYRVQPLLWSSNETKEYHHLHT